MRPVVAVLFCACMAGTLCSAIPKPDENDGKDKRVHEQPLSDSEHYDENKDHNADYDHEAFLGKEDAHSFDDLSPEESKDRLGKIFDKIDTDTDGLVTEEELQQWIKRVQSRYIVEDTNRQWEDHEHEDGKISWDSYIKRTYGTEHAEGTEGGENFADMQRRDKRRWGLADTDKDEVLTKEEFMSFLHPEEAEHMKGVVVDETIEDIDKDKDGYIQLEEYIADVRNDGDDEDEDETEEPDWLDEEKEDFESLLDKNGDGHLDREEVESWIMPDPDQMYSDESQHLMAEADSDENPDESEPDWIQTEREQFTKYRDLDQDGKMNRDEVRNWILPDDYDHTDAEAKHLIYESDSNKDDKLSREEVLDKYDLFVGSQATDFGEALTRHDEF